MTSDTRRASLLVLYQVPVLAMSLVVGIIVARLLGAYGRGAYVLAFLPAQLLSSLCASMADATVYAVSREPERHGAILRILASFTVTASLLSGAGLLGGWFAFRDTVLRGVPLEVFAIATAGFPVYLLTALAQSYLFATERTAASQLPIVCERVVTFTGVCIAAALGLQLAGVVAVTVAGAIAGALYALLAIGRAELTSAIRANREPKLAADMRRYARQILLGNLAQKLTYRLDQLVLNLFAGPAAVGIYSVAARAAELALVAPRALRSSWAATRARAGSLRETAPATFAGTRRLMVLMGAGLPLFGSLLGPLLPVIYGPEFSAAVLPFFILLVATLAVSASFAFVSSLTGAGEPRRVAAAAWIGALATVALDIALIPAFGAAGAAAASALALTTFTVAVWVQWRRAARPQPGVKALIPRGEDVRAVAALIAGPVQRFVRPTRPSQ